MLQKTGNPTLKSIQAVAEVFGLDAWELLIDTTTARNKLMGRIFSDTEPTWRLGDIDRRSSPNRRSNGQ
jgi:hypothetical protein